MTEYKLVAIDTSKAVFTLQQFSMRPARKRAGALWMLACPGNLRALPMIGSVPLAWRVFGTTREPKSP